MFSLALVSIKIASAFLAKFSPADAATWKERRCAGEREENGEDFEDFQPVELILNPLCFPRWPGPNSVGPTAEAQQSMFACH